MKTLKTGHIINCCGQEIHEDAKVLLNEPDRKYFGNARFIDALTFVRRFPQKYLGETFTLGTKVYEGDSLNNTQTDKTAFKHMVPEVYRLNGWE